MSESEVLHKILLKLGVKSYLKIWRNNTGQAWQGERHSLKAGGIVIDTTGRVFKTQAGDCLLRRARPVKFGLVGSGDIAGIISPNGTALYIETKFGKYKQTEQQKRFAKMIESMGGIYIVAKNPATIEEQIQEKMRLKNGKKID